MQITEANLNPAPVKDVLVDVAVPVPLRQLFTYKVPADIDPNRIARGHRALVPFGPRLIYGVTMSAAYRPTEAPSSRLRYLISYDGKQRILAEDIDELVQWIANYYKAPIGEVMRMALPPGLLAEAEIRFRLTEEGMAHVQASDEARILALLEGKAISKKRWEALAQTEIPFRDIRAWEDLGYLDIVAAGNQKESIPHVWAVTLTELGRTADPQSLGRAKRQAELLGWLQQRTVAMIGTEEINQAFPNASSLLAQLSRRDLCRRLRIPRYQLERQVQDFQPDEIKTLTPEQDTSLKAIAAALDERTYQSFLMFGVTGAGKTEVYLRAIQHCLEQGRQALFLVPEIALTPLMQRRITDRFGERLAILHSAVGAGRRSEAWARILAGQVDVVLGARSGIFAPLPNLGLLIVDEEHDQSYKQNDGVRYHARDLAMVRAHRAGAIVVLGSATPSLESWVNHQQGRGQLLTLKKRATRARLPKVNIVDMREEFKSQRRRPILSTLLLEKTGEALEKQHQIMILLNRRGYHSFMLCRKCGESVMCDQCEVSLTYHQTDRSLKCHYCAETSTVPETCPSCGSPSGMMQFFGEGTQQIQELVARSFPKATVDRLDRDRLSRREAHQEILADFENRKTDILVGTQMIAKGHDFPNVTLVGIVNADQGLRMPDFRCAETVFQLITQVAGRSGRGKNPGSVVIQTYMPEHYSIVAAAQHDYEAFLKKEIRYRRHLFYSPFAHLVALLITHKDDDVACNVSTWMAEQFNNLRKGTDMVVLGPARAPIGRIKKRLSLPDRP